MAVEPLLQLFVLGGPPLPVPQPAFAPFPDEQSLPGGFAPAPLASSPNGIIIGIS